MISPFSSSNSTPSSTRREKYFETSLTIVLASFLSLIMHPPRSVSWKCSSVLSPGSPNAVAAESMPAAMAVVFAPPTSVFVTIAVLERSDADEIAAQSPASPPPITKTSVSSSK